MAVVPLFLLIVPLLLALGVVYYVLLVCAILQMLRRDVNQVLLVFAFLSLIPTLFVVGVCILIIWHIHKGEAKEGG